MKIFNLAAIAAMLLIFAACKKQATNESVTPAPPAAKSAQAAAALACTPVYFNLAVDPSTGFSYLYKVSGSPSAGPITVTPVLGSLGTNQLLLCTSSGSVPVKLATGLSYDPSTGIFWGTVGAAGSPANNILRFTDPNCISAVPATPGCAITLDLSDIERNPATGVYYAINRGTVSPNNRVVRLGLPGTPSVNCLSATIPPSLALKGLTFTSAGLLYIISTSNNTGTLYNVNPGTGAITASYPYPGPITNSPPVNTPELGLHYDDLCIKRFITGNYDPFAPPTLITDGLPTALGGPFYSAASGVLKPTVDFARP